MRILRCIVVVALAGMGLVPSERGEGATRGSGPGPLFLIGGAEDKTGDATILRAFVRAAGGSSARLLVLTYPEPDPLAAADRYRVAFERLGVARVRVLHLPERATADSEAAAAAVDEADGVFFTGGGQWGIVGTVKGTRLDAAMRRRWGLGMAIAGTSAGAALMPSTMLSYGTSAVTPRAGDVDLDPGLGLVQGVLIDSHFSQRGRINRLLSALSERPADLGVGIDEDTALVLDGDRFEVLGTGIVTVVDATRAALNSRPASSRDRPIALSGVTLHILPSGYSFDLKTRTALPPADRPGR
jgi:cyanophycinase